ncbi:CHAT domain-containing protein [Streptomyces sp. NPDC048595]|uniref:CHAT domain-containing protein n=1 Tax=Streptomyces sp. NPDC048595 TaxID=3365576 RepID=UPI00371584F3
MADHGISDLVVTTLSLSYGGIEDLLDALHTMPEIIRADVRTALEEQARTAAARGRTAHAEWLGHLLAVARRAQSDEPPPADGPGGDGGGGHETGGRPPRTPRGGAAPPAPPEFAPLLVRTAQLPSLLDQFLVFRRHRDVLPAEPLAEAQRILENQPGIQMEEYTAVLAALAMAAGGALHTVHARTWWAFSLMERAARAERLGFGGTGASTRDRRHALHHAARAVAALPPKAPADDPDPAFQAYHALARAHRGLGDYRAGLAVLLEGERELFPLGVPDDEEGRRRWMHHAWTVADELSGLGYHTEALRRFDSALQVCRVLSGGAPVGSLVELLTQRGKTLLHADRPAAATADFERAAAAADRLGMTIPACRARGLAASALTMRGREREALRLLEANLAAARRGGDQLLHGYRCALAAQLRTVGDLAAAEEQYLLALREIHAQPAGSRNEIGCLFGLGELADDLGNHEWALEWCRRGMEAGRRHRREQEAAAHFAMALRRMLDRDTSVAAAERLLPVLRSLLRDTDDDGSPVPRSAVGGTLVGCLQRLGRHDEALDLGRRLIALADEIGDTAVGRQERTWFAGAFAAREELRQERFDLLWWCRETTLRQLAETPVPHVRAEVAGRALGLYEQLLELLVDHGDTLDVPDRAAPLDLCFALHEEVRARDLLADLAHGPLPVPPEVPEADALEERELLAGLRAQLTRSVLDPADDFTDATLTALLDRLAALRERIRPHAPGYARLREGRTVGAAGARALLERHAPPGGMALVSYFCGHRATYCFVLASDGVPLRVHRVPLTRERIAQLARRLRADFNGDPHAERPTPPIQARRPHKRKLAYLSELTPLLAPFDDLLERYPLLAVAGHGPLTQIPLAALPRGNGRRLGETTAVVDVPGISAIGHLTAPPAPPPATAMTAGCAAREDEDPAIVEDDDALLRPGPWHTARPLSGTEATPGEALQALRGTDLAHLAAHGYAGSDDPLDAALLLSDGRSRPSRVWAAHDLPAHAPYLLRARDVAAAGAAPGRLVLRACSAGWSDPDHPGADLTGMTWAFLRAGARAVVAPRWNVDIALSRELLAAFYRRLGAGEPTWRALWLAQRAMAEDTDRPWLGHPYHWSAFTLTGDWR